jgi:hypothetical protein
MAKRPAEGERCQFRDDPARLASVRSGSARGRHSRAHGDEYVRLRKSSGAVTPATRRATTSARLPFAETGGSAALDFIGEQLEADQARRQSFEQRGLALVASAGGFVTILFGLIAIASRADDHRAIVTVPDSARSLVVAALPLLFIATLAGIAAGFPLRYVVPESAPGVHGCGGRAGAPLARSLPRARRA